MGAAVAAGPQAASTTAAIATIDTIDQILLFIISSETRTIGWVEQFKLIELRIIRYLTVDIGGRATSFQVGKE